MPYAFTEAKIQMALFQRWRQMHGLSLTRALLAAKDEKLKTVEQAFEEPIKHSTFDATPVKSQKDLSLAPAIAAKQKVQVFTGQELESFIQRHVRQCLRAKIESMLLTL